MKTMVKEPYVHHVPVMTGGIGYRNVYNFYKNDYEYNFSLKIHLSSASTI